MLVWIHWSLERCGESAGKIAIGGKVFGTGIAMDARTHVASRDLESHVRISRLSRSSDIDIVLAVFLRRKHCARKCPSGDVYTVEQLLSLTGSFLSACICTITPDLHLRHAAAQNHLHGA